MGMGRLYARLAAAVILRDRDRAALEVTTAERQARGTAVTADLADLSERAAIEQAAARIAHVKVTTVCPAVHQHRHVRWCALQHGEALVTLPWTVRLSMFLKGALPQPLFDWLAGRVFGVYSTMTDFKGRRDC